ncbi:hypothetical protein MMC18_008280 [Xylographa bjoerkii]|nr:hypothetical protein [Xylographa bjoerkii]
MLPFHSFRHVLANKLFGECAKRWQHNLDPRLDRQRWTPKEDELLLESVNRYGREWRKIQEKHYSTRSANDLKNRFTILSKKITSIASSRSGLGPAPGHPSSSSPTVVGQNQESTSPGTDPGSTSGLNSSPSTEEGMECVYNPSDRYVDMCDIMQPTTNVQHQREQQIRPQEQAATLLPPSLDTQSMNVDDLDLALATSGFAWTTCPTPPSGIDSRPFTSGDFPNAMLSNDLATMSHHHYHHSQTDAGDSNGLGSSSSHEGNSNAGVLVYGFDTDDPVPDGMKNGQLPSLLAHRASRLGNCSPGGSVCLQTEGCDREVLNYLIDVLLPIRCLVKIDINM